ncbi:hypothetical protein NC653_040962 [Populus alba x Populus x berolinensis]|uniref:EF-hand domain-containing protein n=1 Tax=Populus alba x Populus x berolinensis TaxID=444605 RepID=A0AAD6PND8_9ROSI|nr:hypothetical protein NC653_040962 [Populus alba x Populus x berolinensis]
MSTVESKKKPNLVGPLIVVAGFPWAGSRLQHEKKQGVWLVASMRKWRDTEEIRRAAEAYYENLSDEKKRNARFSFNEMDKNGDGKINLDEFVEYLEKDNNTYGSYSSKLVYSAGQGRQWKLEF